MSETVPNSNTEIFDDPSVADGLAAPGAMFLPPDDDPDGDAWLDDTAIDPVEQARNNRITALRRGWFGDLAAPYYDGEELPEVTPEEVSAWYSQLPEHEQALLADEKDYARQHELTAQNVLENLQKTAPSLLEGRLPEDQDTLLVGTEYALGVRQVGLDTAGEAQRDTLQWGGVSSAGQALSQSFNIVTFEHPHYASSTMVRGYYGADRGGKYVVVLPAKPGEGSLRVRATEQNESLFDITRSTPNGQRVIDQKYCAGFIDNDGVYFPNKTFMADGKDAADFGVESAPENQDWL